MKDDDANDGEDSSSQHSTNDSSEHQQQFQLQTQLHSNHWSWVETFYMLFLFFFCLQFFIVIILGTQIDKRKILYERTVTCIVRFSLLWVYKQWYDQIMCFSFCFLWKISYTYVKRTSGSEFIILYFVFFFSFALFFFLLFFMYSVFLNIVKFEMVHFSVLFWLFSTLLHIVLSQSSASFSFQISIHNHIFIFNYDHYCIFFFKMMPEVLFCLYFLFSQTWYH